ncbi:MAG: 3-dehydroquinate synthase [Candidatus Margulisiibacteriota bacterium]|jgi:3-dehydroquinate synthase
MRIINVELGAQSYQIVIAAGLYLRPADYWPKKKLGKKLAIITESKQSAIYKEYRNTVWQSFKQMGYKPIEILLPAAGEPAKNLQTTEMIFNELARHDLDRDSTLIALGGGVVGDIVGFVAATYLRGINYIQMPTTLLSQVDSSVGGKTGVNLPAGKNLVGCFYQPKLVLIDLNTLSSLPAREFRTGMAEVIKYGMIKSPKLFARLEKLPDLSSLKKIGQENIQEIVAECCQIKADIVKEDEREAHLRMILNFGHTVGHALEAETKYTEYTHGEAIAIGMIVAGEIGVEMKKFPPEEMSRLRKLIEKAGLPSKMPELDKRKLLDAMYKDKKNKDEKLTFVLPKRIGEVEIVRDVPEREIKKAIAKAL